MKTQGARTGRAGSAASCAVCGGAVERVPQHFPQREPPHGRPFLRALYFSDSFFGGSREEYCSPACRQARTARGAAKGGTA